MQNEERKKQKNETETVGGHRVTGLKRIKEGFSGFVEGVRMIWDDHGITGKGYQWTLRLPE